MHTQKTNEVKLLTEESQGQIVELKIDLEKKNKKLQMHKQFMAEIVADLTQSDSALKTKMVSKQQEFLEVLLSIFAKHLSREISNDVRSGDSSIENAGMKRLVESIEPDPKVNMLKMIG